MPESWRIELRVWAERCLERWKNRDGVLGVMMGGSLARGQEWQHSDLESGILVETRDAQLPYFNVIEGRGVEAIQLIRSDLEEQVKLVEHGEVEPLLKWPIQLWQARVYADPSGLLERFKTQFDKGLFTQTVLDLRIANLRQQMDGLLNEARSLVEEGKPAAALSKTRLAMNEAILARYWAHGELPRSQNRTDSRLRWLCRKYADPDFYTLYREVFDLIDPARVVKKTWPDVKDQVLMITRLWGDSAHDFFVHAVDGDFQWRQTAGILTVYRLYIPMIGGPEAGIARKLDDPDWAYDHGKMLEFLGLKGVTQQSVSSLIERVSLT